jgi:hypothetical protein
MHNRLRQVCNELACRPLHVLESRQVKCSKQHVWYARIDHSHEQYTYHARLHQHVDDGVVPV